MVKILLVEDDSNLREIYGARLEAEGYEIVSASDGEEALAIAVRERPNLIISDVMMPKISGFDMLDILRSTPETKDVKVIVMTALSQDEDRQRGEQLGADKYVVKSQVTLDDVVLMVQELTTSAGSSVPPQTSDDAQSASNSSDLGDQTIVTPDPSISTDSSAAPTSDAVTPADENSLNNEVAQFVANSPLMNGAAPQPLQNQNLQQPATENSQSPQQPQPPVQPTQNT